MGGGESILLILHKSTYNDKVWLGLDSLFNGIVAYLMPKLSLKKNSIGTF